MQRWSHLLAITLVVMMLSAPTWAQDREVAEQIAGILQTSGQLRGYDIRVKFDHGTAWLRGHVANEQQMSAALTLAFQANGVEQVVNGLSVRPESNRPPRRAPSPSPKPVDYAIDHARLVARSAPVAPVPAAQPYQSPSFPRSSPPGYSEIQTGESTSKPQVAPAMRVVTEPLEPIKMADPDALLPAEQLRRPNLASTSDALPATAQKACYLTATSQVLVADLHMATTLSGAAEPMLLPDQSAGSAGEALASDEIQDPPALLGAHDENATVPASPVTRPIEQAVLIQTLPEPTRRTWAGNFGERGLPTMRASVESKP